MLINKIFSQINWILTYLHNLHKLTLHNSSLCKVHSKHIRILYHQYYYRILHRFCKDFRRRSPLKIYGKSICCKSVDDEIVIPMYSNIMFWRQKNSLKKLHTLCRNRTCTNISTRLFTIGIIPFTVRVHMNAVFRWVSCQKGCIFSL